MIPHIFVADQLKACTADSGNPPPVNEVEKCLEKGGVPVCLMAPGNTHIICPNANGAAKGVRPENSFIMQKGDKCGPNEAP